MATADTLTNDMRHEANTALLEIDKGKKCHGHYQEFYYNVHNIAVRNL